MNDAITRVNPKTPPDSSSVGYSQISVVEPGRMAYISGQVPIVRGEKTVPESLKEQMRVVSMNAQHALYELGTHPTDIVLARVYVVNLTSERMSELMPAFLETFNGEKPCITGIGVAALANPDFQIELELIVRLPD